MSLFHNTSIKQHLTFTIMLISAISVIITTIAISVIGVFALESSIQQELEGSASIIGDRNRAALSFDRPDQAEESLESFISIKDSIQHACLYDASGEVFAQSSKEKNVISRCPALKSEGSIIGDHYIHVVKYLKGKEGAVYIKSNLSEIEHYKITQTGIAVVVMMAVFILSFIMAISIQGSISRPILNLAATAREVSQNQDYNIRARPFGNKGGSGNNEIVSLMDAFNTMLTEIGSRDHQLKQQNIELERSKNVAEQANIAKSQFLANISHELRTPLNAIIGFSSIITNQLFGPLGDDKYLDYAKDINDSGSHLLDIINDILDLSKAEAGKLDLNYEEIFVPKALKKCMTIISDRAEKGQVKLETNIEKGVPTLIADRLRFIQVVLNILSNAVKFTPVDGTVSLCAGAIEEEGVETHIAVSISDTGIGMSQDDIEKAFQSFGQVDSGLNRKYEGTGLGLPLTRKLVELHHGHINVESELGVGTTVTITMPLIPPIDAFKDMTESNDA